MSSGRLIWLLMFGALVIRAQPPAIIPGGIVNLASRHPAMLPSGSIARGSQIEISGVRLGSSAREINVSLTQPPSATAISLPVISVTPARIHALMPRNAPPGPAAIVVTRQGEASKPFAIKVVGSSFGIFTANGEGWGPARFPPSSPVSFASPARPGNILTITGTGLGDEPRPRVLIAGRPAELIRVNRRAEGLEEISFRVPRDAPDDCFIPVYVRSSRWVSNPATVPIARAGRCKPSSDWPLAPMDPGKTVALMVFTRESLHFRANPENPVNDHGILSFVRSTGHATLVAPVHLMPPPGACITSAGFFDADLISAGLISLSSMTGVDTELRDAGAAIRLTRPDFERVLTARPDALGLFVGRLGGTTSGRRNLPLFLDPGEITVDGQGGSAIGAFSFKAHGTADFTWLNRDRLTRIDRKSGFAVEWSDPRRGPSMLIFAVGIDRDTRTTSLCVCRAARSDQRFFVGPDALANFPPVADEPTDLPALVGLAALESSPAGTIHAPGVDTGFAVTIRLEATQVAIR